LRLWGAPHTRSTLSSTRSSLAHRRWRLQGRPRPRPQSSLTGWARSCPSFSGRKILLRRRNPSQVLQCSSPGSVSRWTGGGSRARPRLSPFIAILDLMRVGGWRGWWRGGREPGQQPPRGNSQLRFSLSSNGWAAGTGSDRIRWIRAECWFLAALQHGTTIFLINCEFLRFVHNKSFTGLDFFWQQSAGGGSLLIFGDCTVDTFQQGYQIAAGHVRRGHT